MLNNPDFWIKIVVATDNFRLESASKRNSVRGPLRCSSPCNYQTLSVWYFLTKRFVCLVVFLEKFGVFMKFWPGHPGHEEKQPSSLSSVDLENRFPTTISSPKWDLPNVIVDIRRDLGDHRPPHLFQDLPRSPRRKTQHVVRPNPWARKIF